jgi:hypothetical protein
LQRWLLVEVVPNAEPSKLRTFFGGSSAFITLPVG